MCGAHTDPGVEGRGVSLRGERPVGWPGQRVGTDLKKGRVAGANPPGLVGLYTSHLLKMFESLC